MQNDKQQKDGLSWVAPAQPILVTAKASAPAAQTPRSQIPTYAGILVGGIIVGILLSWGWSATRSAGVPIATTMATSTAAAQENAALTSPSMDSGLLVNSPQKAGDSVMIASVSVNTPTWVVVYEETDGKPGNALGARLFETGAENASVELLRDTTPGEQYLVGESLDDGSHIFSLKDTQVTQDGQTLWIAFKAE